MKPLFSIFAHIYVLVTQIKNHNARRLILPSDNGPKGNAANASGVACLLLLGFIIAGATTIVVVRTDKVVVLGADSRIVRVDVSTGKSQSFLGCKIEQIGNIFFAADGQLKQDNGFNAYELAREASLKGGGVIAVADRFETMAEKPLAAMLRNFRKEDFTEFCDHKECLQVIFVGFDKAQPISAVRRFSAEIDGKEIIVKPLGHLDCPGECPQSNITMVLGVNSMANRMMETPNFGQQGVIQAVDDLIGTEVKATGGNEVSRPIAILIMDKDGARWADGHQGVCPDINH
jgi:hypothetical protein